MEEIISQILQTSRTTFENKLNDYGDSWKVFRPISLIDQILIKLLRIRSIQESSNIKVIDESLVDTVYSIVNYSLIYCIKTEDTTDYLTLYDKHIKNLLELFSNKNSDYGDAWKEIELESLVDLMLVKLYRIKQILKNDGKTKVSEGVLSNVYDIINYSIFLIIRMS